MVCICIAEHTKDLNSPSSSVWIQSFDLDCVPLEDAVPYIYKTEFSN